jgi:Tfp pilus assembly protein PilV
MINKKERKTEGFALIDALIGVVIASILSAAFLSSIYQASVTSSYARDQLTASLAMLEMYEIGVAMSLNDYDDFVTELLNTCTTNCHFSVSGGNWSIVSGTETVDIRFQRSFSVQGVTRDVSGDIDGTQALQPGNETIELTTSITWESRGQSFNEEIVTYLHRINP